MTISFKVSDKTKEKLIDHYEYTRRDKTPQYAVFQANDGDSVVTLYESGKIVFQGKDADIASDFWVSTEKMNNKSVDVKNSDEKTKDKKNDKPFNSALYHSTSLGSDEVGTGDYFGPIVVSSAYVKKDVIPFLEDLGVTDSKKLTDDKILEIVPKLITKVPYVSFILSNKQYNEMYGTEMNMNKIKAVLHNKVLLKLREQCPTYDYIVVDQFTTPRSYFNYLKDSPKCNDITFETKAESKNLAVACASLISRFVFLKEMDKLSRIVGFNIPKGAGDKVNEAGLKILNEQGVDKLKTLAKYNFKNTDKINDLNKS